jgi:hypothetical protein
VQPPEIAELERYTAARHDEARQLEAQLGVLNARLGEARVRQERMQRPTTVLTEWLPQRLSERLRRRR